MNLIVMNPQVEKKELKQYSIYIYIHIWLNYIIKTYFYVIYFVNIYYTKTFVVAFKLAGISMSGLFFTWSSSKLTKFDIISLGICFNWLSFKFNTFKFFILAKDGGNDSSLLLLKSIVSNELLLIFSRVLSILQMHGCVTFSQNKFLQIRSSLDDKTRAFTSY